MSVLVRQPEWSSEWAYGRLIQSWPVYRQLTGADPLGRGKAAQSPSHVCAERRGPPTPTASRTRSARTAPSAARRRCTSRTSKVVQIEGDPDTPISRGRLCPKGSASKQLVTGPQREHKVRYRAPYATEWADLDLDTAMDMVADRVLDARRKGWQDTDADGNTLRRTMGIASLGGATLDNEENYLIKKLFTALGAMQIENQARI